MNIYKYVLESKKYVSEHFEKDNICFLDIETTGFSREYNNIYLIGLLYFNAEDNNWCLIQFFADHIDEEKKLLEDFNNFINRFDLIITYNGERFDLPFINHRLKKFNIESKLYDINNFDIYKKIKINNSYLNFKNLKLKTIEENLNIYRTDEYSGKDCINFYYQYIKTEDMTLKNKILKHNYDDLYYLIDILQIFDVIRDIKTTYVDYNDKRIEIKIDDIIVDNDVFNISCQMSPTDKDINIVYFQEGFNINWKEKRLLINLEIKEGFITPTKKCLFIDTSHFKATIKDNSQYMVPDNIILLRVENKYEMKNIKNIINLLISFI